MRAKNITVLPVIDADDKLVGEVRLNDLLKLRSKQEKSIETIVRTEEVHSVLRGYGVGGYTSSLNDKEQFAGMGD